MIPQLGQLPSLWRVAGKVAEALSVPKLVVISFPNASVANVWIDVIVPTILEYLRIQEDVEDSADLYFDESNGEPLQSLGVALDMTIERIEDFLYPTYGEPVVTMHWKENQPMPSRWQHFLQLILSAIEQSDHTMRFRKLIILDKGNRDFPEFLKGNPSVEHFQLWNALTWEELRLLASSKLRDEANDIRRSWMISTYSGASNFDLRVLAHLCDTRPMSIDSTMAEARKVLSADSDQHQAQIILPDGQFGREWRPPAGVLEAWQCGSIIGATIERGCVRPWNAHNRAERDAIAHHFVWKEQVSGLFPLLIELGRELNERILEKYGEKLAHSVPSVAEPTEMISAIRNSHFWLPQSIYEALEKLRDARNQLAHLEPLERRDLEAIWDTQLRIRAGQY